MAVKSLLCALFLDCFLSVRPAASAPEEFSVFFSKTEKNAARVPLQPPTRQTSLSQMLICFRTRGPAWHSPHTPLLQRNLGGHPLSPHHPLPATTTGCSPAGQIKHPRHELCFWDICLCCMSALFSPLHADSHLSGHTAIWVSFASALCVCCWAELPLPEPLPTWRVLQVCLEHLVHSLVCLCDLSDKPAVLRCEHSPLLVGDFGASEQDHHSEC